MKLTIKLKAALLLLIMMLPTIIHAEENQEAEVIWVGNGSYVYREPSDGKVTYADVASVSIILWQNGNKKFFTTKDEPDVPYANFYKNPDYSKYGSKGYLSNAEYIIETEKYGKVYTNPNINGNPMDYYSNEKKRKLGIVYPVTAQGIKKNSEGQYVFDDKAEKITLVLHRIDDTDDYYATYEGKRYDITEGPEVKVKRFVKVKKEPQYYHIKYKGTLYAFTFDKL